MKNQTKRETERELLLKLREAVNSREEFEWVESELARLDQHAVATLRVSPVPTTVAVAANFLETQCGLLLVQVAIEPALWCVASPQRDYTAVISSTELLALSQSQRRNRVNDKSSFCPTQAHMMSTRLAMGGHA